MMIDCIKHCLLWSQWTFPIYITLGSALSSRECLVETSAYKLHPFSGENNYESPLQNYFAVSE